jgi:polyhydroxyalkanoate synthesis regulator protein
MIRFYGNSMQSYFSSYLEKSVETFMRQQEVMQQQVNRTMGPVNGAPNPLAELARQNLELWAKMQETMLATFVPPREPSRDNPQANNTKNKTGGKASDSDADES